MRYIIKLRNFVYNKVKKARRKERIVWLAGVVQRILFLLAGRQGVKQEDQLICGDPGPDRHRLVT